MANYTATSTVLLNGQQAEELLTKLKKKSEDLGKEWSRLAEAGDKAGMQKIEKEMKSVSKATEKLTKDTMEVEKVLKNLSGASLDELRTAQKKLNAEMSKMDRNSEEFKQAAKNAKLLNDEIANGKIQAGQWRSPMQKLTEQAKQLLPAFSFAAIAAGATKAFTTIVNSTDTLSTQWAVFMGGMKGATSEFFRTMATGDFTNFIENMGNAIKVGREYERVLDDLEAKQRAMGIAEADSRAEIVSLEEQLKNVGLTPEQRLAAGNRRIQIEEELAARRTKIAQDEFNNEMMMAKQASKLDEDRLQELIAANSKETILQAEALNAIRTRYNKLSEANKVVVNGVKVPGMATAEMNELKSEMTSFPPFIVSYANDLVKLGNVTDEQLNKVVNAYTNLKNAEVSGRESIKRVITMVDSLKAAEKQKENNNNTGGTDLSALLGASIEQQQQAIRDYFAKAGEGAFDAFLAAIDKSQQEKKIDFSVVPALPEEQEQEDPEVNNAIEKYKETLEFKLALIKAMGEQEIISAEEVERRKTEILKNAETERIQIIQKNVEKFNDIATLGVNFISTLKDMELEIAGDNEEQKLQIRKKYADEEFAITAAGIIASTALAIVKTWEGYANMGIIGTFLAGVQTAFLVGLGVVQYNKAKQARNAIKEHAEGGYTNGEKLYIAGEAGTEWIAPNWMTNNPETAAIIAELEEKRKNPAKVVSGINVSRLPLLNTESISTTVQSRSFTSSNPSSFNNASFNKDSTSTTDSLLVQTLADLKREIRNFQNWKPKVYTETIKKDLDLLDTIEKERGL